VGETVHLSKRREVSRVVDKGSDLLERFGDFHSVHEALMRLIRGLICGDKILKARKPETYCTWTRSKKMDRMQDRMYDTKVIKVALRGRRQTAPAAL
jgi:hypothetical protein